MTLAPSLSTPPFCMGLGGWGWGTRALLHKRSPGTRHLWGVRQHKREGKARKSGMVNVGTGAVEWRTGAENGDDKMEQRGPGKGQRREKRWEPCYRTVLPGILAWRVTNPRPSSACSTPPPPNSLESWCLRRPSCGLSQAYSSGIILGPRVGLILKREGVYKQEPELRVSKKS